MDSTSLRENNQDIIKEMPVNTVFPKCVQNKKDRVIMHTDMYGEDALMDDGGIM